MKKIIFLCSSLLLVLFFSKCNRTHETVLPFNISPNNPVFAMAVYKNELYIGGCFDSVGNVHSSYIAKWDGKKWTTVGKGLEHGYRGVEALVVYKGELYASGDFERTGDISLGHIAKWDGSEWSPVGIGIATGTHPYISDLCVYKNELYAACLFDSISSVKAKNIARWNGKIWNNAGSGVDYTVISLAVYKDELYAGGICNDEGGNLVKWDGDQWSYLTNATDTTNFTEVQSYCIYKNDLITGGTFGKRGNNPYNHIAKWNGKQFDKFETDIDDPDATVTAMEVYNDVLYAGGHIQSPDRQKTAIIIKWDGKDWKTIASDTNGYASCFITYNGELLTGGTFRNLNGQSIKFLAKINSNQ